MRLRYSIVIALAAIAVASPPAYAGGAQYVVRGAPLVAGRHSAGAVVSVYDQPGVVGVAGCRTSRVRVGASGSATLAVSASVRCRGVRTVFRLQATIRGSRLSGVFAAGSRRRRFTAARRAVPGVLVGGSATEAAAGVIGDVDRAVRHLADVVAGGVVLTEIVATFGADATCAQADAALEAVGGRIVGSLPHDLRVAVAIPDAGSRQGLEAVLAALRTQPGVEGAEVSRVLRADALPPGFGSPPLSGSADGALQHLIAIGMPAAWNAKTAIQSAQKPTVLVVDFFGAGPMSSELDAAVTGALGPYPSGRADDHGYHVAGIIAGNHRNDGTAAGRVTGVFPGRTTMIVEDKHGTGEATNERILRVAAATPGRLVVNTSLGYPTPATDAEAAHDGGVWATRVRAIAGLEDRLFQATAASNDSTATTPVKASIGSDWNAATLRSDLTLTPGGTIIAPLRNVASIENVYVAATPDHAPRCLRETSNVSGTVAAPGVRILSFNRNGAPVLLSGTSMASPIIAGLAEYLWSIAPDLTAPQLRNAIVMNADPPVASCSRRSAPIVNAYRAVLSLDRPMLLTPASAPVRLAIVDVDGNGAFDEHDLRTLVGHVKGHSPTRPDWSRYDLNGDGFTGGARSVALDLDPVGSVRAGAASMTTATVPVEGTGSQFNERSVRDLDALCFFAYSGLYTGIESTRRSLLGAATCRQPFPVGSSSNPYAAGGTIVFEHAGAVAAMDTSGGHQRLLGYAGDRPALALDGRVAFRNAGALMVGSLTGAGATDITGTLHLNAFESVWDPFFLDVTPGGDQYVAFAATTFGNAIVIRWVDPAGVWGAQGHGEAPGGSANGSLVSVFRDAVHRGFEVIHLLSHPASGSEIPYVETDFMQSTLFTVPFGGPAPTIGPLTSVALSPDGTRVAFEANAGASPQPTIFVADGSGIHQLVAGARNPTWLSASEIAYDAQAPGGRVQIFKVPAAGGTPTQLTH